MSDKLEEAKQYFSLTLSSEITEYSIGLSRWLISELEQSRAENAELQAVFDLQETRTKRAEKMWQQATGKHDTLPDLGVLLDWLMGEVKRLKALLSYQGIHF